MEYILDFEKPVQLLESQIKELKSSAQKPGIDISKEIQALEFKVDNLIKEIYSNLNSWERVQLSRHPLRPHTSDYINAIVQNFCELHGDRSFADDGAVIGGLGYIDNHKVVVVGVEKGRGTKDKIRRNFGMANPEGYRKILRLMKMAEQFGLPVITFIDTPGAYPGIGAEERGQAYSIANNLEQMALLKTPIISVVIGEGGSGGALGLALADAVAMLEYAIYSVISPESCASILWSDPKRAEYAANSLQLTADKAHELAVVDAIIAEPAGGAHRNYQAAAQEVRRFIITQLESLKKMSAIQMRKKRQQKFRQMGNQYLEYSNTRG